VVNRGSYEDVCGTLESHITEDLPITIDDILLDEEESTTTTNLHPSSSQA